MSDVDGSNAIRGVAFDPDGSIGIEYSRPAYDGRLPGVLVNHTVFISAGRQYDDEIEAARDAMQALLASVLEDLDDLPGPFPS